MFVGASNLLGGFCLLHSGAHSTIGTRTRFRATLCSIVKSTSPNTPKYMVLLHRLCSSARTAISVKAPRMFRAKRIHFIVPRLSATRPPVTCRNRPAMKMSNCGEVKVDTRTGKVDRFGNALFVVIKSKRPSGSPCWYVNKYLVSKRMILSLWNMRASATLVYSRKRDSLLPE